MINTDVKTYLFLRESISDLKTVFKLKDCGPLEREINYSKMGFHKIIRVKILWLLLSHDQLLDKLKSMESQIDEMASNINISDLNTFFMSKEYKKGSSNNGMSWPQFLIRAMLLIGAFGFVAYGVGYLTEVAVKHNKKLELREKSSNKASSKR